MNRLILIFLFMTFPSEAYVIKLDDDYSFSFLVTKSNSTIKMTAKSIGNKGGEFEIHDYIYDCDLDSELSLIRKSLERKSIDGVPTTLFAYRIGCVGGIDAIPVKYFAFQHGVKHALRGEETIQISNESYGGESGPIPSSNLKRKPSLYEYMRSRWGEISIRKYE